MKKIYKVLLIIGLLTLGIGLVTGAASGILFVQQANDYSEYNKTLTDEKIDIIDIELSCGELILQQGNDFSIQAENINPDEFLCEVSDETWRVVEQTEENSFFIFGWRVADDILARLIGQQKARVIVTIPHDIILGTVKLCVNSGNIQLNSLYTQNLIAQVGAGQIKVNDCMVLNSLQAQIGVGCMEAKQLHAENSIIECGIGNVDIKGNVEGTMKINNSVGRTCLKIGSLLDGRTHNTHCNVGAIEIGNIGFTGIGVDALHSGSDNNENIDVSCGIGKIEILN